MRNGLLSRWPPQQGILPGQARPGEDLALVKASLLYADKVKLCSVGSSFLSAMAEYAEAPEKERAKLVVRYLTVLQPSMSTDEFASSRRGGHALQKRGARDLKQARKEIWAWYVRRVRSCGGTSSSSTGPPASRGLGEAVREEVLEVHTFGQTSVESLVEAHLKGDETG